MIFGQNFGCPFGNPQNWFSNIETTDFGGGLIVDCPEGSLPGMDCWWRLILDNMPQGTPQYAAGGTPMNFKGVYSQNSPHSWAIFCQGGFSGMNIDPTIMLIVDALAASTCLTAKITGVPSQFSYGDAGQFSNWNLNGATRFNNVKPVQGEPTWGGLDLSMTSVGSVHTITLALDGVTQASGVITGNGSITFTDQGGGIAGTATLNYTADIPAANPATMIFDWPASYRIYYQITPWTVPPAGAPQAIIFDNGVSGSYSWRSATLAAGTYYLLVHQVDENGNEGTGLQGGGIEIAIDAVPPAPDEPQYVSNIVNSGISITTISVTITEACTLNIYDSGTSGLLDVTSPVASYIEAAPGTIDITLPAISGSYTGPRYILVRAEVGGFESLNYDTTTFEYIFGAVVLPAPNVPTLTCNSNTKNGLSVSVPFTVSLENQAAQPASVSLYLYPQGGAPGAASGQTSNLTPVGSGNTGHLMMGTVIGSVAVPGLYMFVLASESADGNFSPFSPAFGPFMLDTNPPVDPGVVAYPGQ